MYNGILFIDKPAGISSFGVVAQVRRNLSQLAGKKVKVGHTGTLDPFASGLMIIVVGDYCKRAGEFSKLDKSYEATVKLGATSSTGDPEGSINPVSARLVTLAEIKTVLPRFTGDIKQTPPAFSAIKINGQRAYKLARAGQQIEMPVRLVKVSRLVLTGYNYPILKFVCDVSSGTYIRSLASDIGEALAVGAYLTALRRTKVGNWQIGQAVSLETTDFSSHLITISA